MFARFVDDFPLQWFSACCAPGLMTMHAAQLTRGILRVGHGRGFVVELDDEQRVIITAAHCWGPRLPYSHIADYQANRTRRLLGPLERKRGTVWAELLFGDPIADIAVLGEPDGQAFHEQWKAYEQLLATMQPLTIADAPAETRTLKKFDWGACPIDEPGTGPVRLLSLDGEWVEAQAERRKWCLWIAPAELLAPGMSGSPIVNPAGAAIGVVSSGSSSDSCLNPVVVDRLPAWLVRSVLAGQKRHRRR
jgi:hypothetical protein